MSKIFVNFLSAAEIPQFRLPYNVVAYEIGLMQNLGVKVVTGKALNAVNGLTISALEKENYECFFIGIGHLLN